MHQHVPLKSFTGMQQSLSVYIQDQKCDMYVCIIGQLQWFALKLWITVELIYIQGVSRLVDITAGGDFLGLCDQTSSYKHVSNFGPLRSFGHFLIPIHALVWTASYGTSRRVMYSTWWLIVCVSCNEQLTQFTTERQPVLRPAVAFSKTSFKHRSI